MPKTKPPRGSWARCPKCGSTKVNYRSTLSHKGYGPGIAGCSNPACNTIWEAFDPDAVPADEHLMPFSEPCNNCAFRKGSPEQEDPEEWQKLLDQVAHWGSSFYCHKGVPIERGAENGFAYPSETKKLRYCRGYLNYTFSQAAENRRAEAANG